MPGYPDDGKQRIVLSGLNDDYNNPQIRTEDALQIDIKIDEGTPLLGKVTSWNNYDYIKCTTLNHVSDDWPITQDTIKNDYAPAKYNVGQPNGKCTVQIILLVQ